MHKPLKIAIANGGQIRAIYDEANEPLLALMSKGESKITRASFVEPTESGEWTADMEPTAPGVVLGPFPRRSEALAAEVQYLDSALF